MDYWLHALAMGACWVLAIVLSIAKFQVAIDTLHRMQLDSTVKPPSELWSSLAIFLGAGFVMLICSFMAIIKRFHDFGSSGWNMLWLIVPFVNIYFTFKLMFFRGEERDNAYGASPYRSVTH